MTCAQTSVILSTDTCCDEISADDFNQQWYNTPVDMSINVPFINPNLDPAQKLDLQKLLSKYASVISNVPGLTNAITHEIKLSSTEYFRCASYPVPLHLQDQFNDEVNTLLELGVIEPSNSPYSSPVIMVQKPDLSYRMVIDFRRINSYIVFDAEPTCNAEDDLHLFTGSKYFSEIDLTRAYHQIPLSDASKMYTAFPTNRGLMQFTRLPFGIVTACAVYVRLMRIVLSGISNVSFYFDNIFIFSKTWSEHLETLCLVFERLRLNGLTAKPTKCSFGVEKLSYLGYNLDGTSITPQQSKIDSITLTKPPTTTKRAKIFSRYGLILS